MPERLDDESFQNLQARRWDTNERAYSASWIAPSAHIGKYLTAVYSVIEGVIAVQDTSNLSTFCALGGLAATFGLHKVHEHFSNELPHLELEANELERRVDKMLGMNPELDQ
jgi:hypothetical protein